MPIATVTTEVMKALPNALRPNPWNIDDDVMLLVERGWTPATIVEGVIRDGVKQPGHVVVSLRRLKDSPSPTERPATPRPKFIGHHPCQQHDNCHYCTCDPNQPMQHHQSTPMPTWFKEQLALTLASTHLPQ